MRYLLYICSLILFAANVSVAQGTSSQLKIYSSKDYKAHSQNFAIVQNKQGVLYFANFSGVLEYDGVFWKTIPTGKITKVSALFLDKNDRLYVGGKDEFGYLVSDKTGAPVFKSVSGKFSGFGAVLSIFETYQGIYFVTKNVVFRWDGRQLKQWKSGPAITSAFFVNGTIYVFQKGPGLRTFNEGVFTTVPVSNELDNLQDVNSMIYADKKTFILTTNQGLYALEDNIVTQFSSESNAFLAGKEAFSGRLLKNGKLAIFAAEGQILMVFPQSGKVEKLMNENYRLADEHVNYWMEDRAGMLWLALNNGIAQLDIASPVTEFGEDNNLRGQVNDVIRFNNTLYAGTSNGLYFLDNEMFSGIRSIRLAVWSLCEWNGSLYAATSKGVFKISKNNTVSQLTSEFALFVYASKTHPGRLYIGLQNGVERLDVGSNAVKTVHLQGIKEQIEKITEDADGILWLETQTNGVIRVLPDGATVARYHEGNGLPTLLLNRITSTSTGLLVSNASGIYRYEKSVDQFTPFTSFTTVPGSAWKGELTEDSEGNIWTTHGDSRVISMYLKHGNEYQEVLKPFLPLSDRTINVIYPDADQLVWFGGSEGLVRFDRSIKKNYIQPYPAFIRKVTATGDSVLFDGLTGGLDTNAAVAGSMKLDYKFNDVSFEFSATSLIPQDNLEFQYYLENFDQTWSAWTDNNQKEYTNIPPGDYRFIVRARNIYHTESTKASFAFTILPPIYQRWWAFVLYVLLIIGSIYFISRKRREFILKKTRDLENLIRERTEEVVNQKEELEQQSEQLSATNDQLERIDDFVKSINSEVNTGKLFQLVLERLCLFQNVDSASALIHNKATDTYQFIAITGGIELADLEDVSITFDQAEQRYMENGMEVYEDIFVKNNFRAENLDGSIEDIYAPKSLITILIRVEGQVKSFITLENTDHENAFGERDFIMVRNLKEHLIGAYIKTDILENLEKTLSNLKSAQEELIRQERLASVGSLTKGIVDRILNPLNYINNFSQSSGNLLKEITEVTEKHQDGLSEDERDDLESGFDMLKKNLEKIYEHGNSTTRIVKDMQKLLKGKSTEFFVTDLNPFLESKTRSAHQEVSNDYKDANVKLTVALDVRAVKVSLLPYEFAQVLTNVISNACYALMEKVKTDKTFVPEITVTTWPVDNAICIRVRDNGKGIAQKETEQLFNPFFTTKPTSKGTGLGLYMSKDIIEYHKGRMSISSKEGEFTQVEIILPVVS
jgi:signal transduction histidine kinase